MSWEAWLTVALVVGLLVSLARNLAPADCLVSGCLLLVCLIGELSGSAKLPNLTGALAGFANPALVTVGALFIVVSGLVHTGAMVRLAGPLLGQPKSVVQAQWRVMLPVAGLSGFLNNTPIVAMFMPVLSDLCRRTGISPSKLFMPLSCAATLGGLCTLIGTSTNLVVSGMIAEQTDLSELHLLTPAWVGVPCCVAGLIFIASTQRWLLPDRRPPISLTDDPRQYSVEMLVTADSPLIGKSIEKAGLRHLPGLFLVEIDRGEEVIAAVGPEQRLAADDRLIFVGIVDSVVDLRKIRGLIPAADQSFRFDAQDAQRTMIEVVVSDRCPLVGQTIREGHFRRVYDSAVVAVARSGRRVDGRIGDIVLTPGDTLLLEAGPSFLEERRNSPDFYLLSSVENSAPPRHERAWTAILILLAMVFAAAFGLVQMLTAAAAAAALMIACGCCSVADARRSIDWSVLIVIGASLGLGSALEASGAAGTIAEQMIAVAGGRPFAVLFAVYLCTMLFTELITNNAAAVLVFPIALSASRALGVNAMPFAMAVMMGASCGFATPIGYQTSLMIFGPGGYRFSDFLRLGVPLDLILMTVSLCLIPIIWPLTAVP